MPCFLATREDEGARAPVRPRLDLDQLRGGPGPRRRDDDVRDLYLRTGDRGEPDHCVLQRREQPGSGGLRGQGLCSGVRHFPAHERIPSRGRDVGGLLRVRCDRTLDPRVAPGLAISPRTPRTPRTPCAPPCPPPPATPPTPPP